MYTKKRNKMKKILLVSILICAVLLSGSCKSTAPPRTAELQPNVQSGSTSTPSVTQPSPTTIPPVSQPSQSSQPSGVVGTGIGSGSGSSGNQSGIILDGAVSYIVRTGDTLSGIARQFYQDGSYYPLIMMVSGGISDIDKIYPNMRFTIPNLMANMNNPTAKDSINRYFLQIANLEDQRNRSETAALIRNHAR
jgi:LysM repeat protein